MARSGTVVAGGGVLVIGGGSDEEAERAHEEPVEQRVVEKLVDETAVEFASGT